MKHGQGDGSLCERIDFNLIRSTLLQAFPTIRGDTVAVRRVFVVERARRVHIANIHVADVRGTQPPKQRFSIVALFFIVLFPLSFAPSSNEILNLDS